MDPIYYFIIGLILALSCFDLVVGVSNDAANFLNSAVGSKAAPRRTIVLVAAVGIIIGSLFSSGMMEIARSGVFMPARFSFHDIMLIFLAVMLTDVILLDVFNTFGLPTSTTVSIVLNFWAAPWLRPSLKSGPGNRALRRNCPATLILPKLWQSSPAFFPPFLLLSSAG